MKITTFLTAFLLLLLQATPSEGQDDKASKEGQLSSGTLSGMKFRALGPAMTSGRIADIAVNPENHKEYYIAVASGGVWKTTNAGITYQPLFDGQGSYSIGCVTIDPNNPHVIWVGTGENNGQRSVAYGDGIYRSMDGGKSWKNMGLKKSEHIGKILVDPRNSNVVYAAAQGPLWSNGGDRGLYKTIDGGTTWEPILTISKYTGVSDIVMDPRDPDVIYATAYQRRRRVFTFISGGPESAILKTTNGGESWDTLRSGIPNVDLGRIGLAISPANPDIVYAIIEAENGKGGFYRSTNRGASWEKRDGYFTSGNYYQEIVCDPKDPDKVYSLDTWAHITTDGGKTFKRLGEPLKHVDNHALWIDPNDTQHLLMGCDGGMYETFDGAANWRYHPNLPVTQFYRVAVDNAEPFYNVYGGTQDNFTLGGPSRTINESGIANSDWFVAQVGDGFEPQIDPKNPDIVYAQAQYGWLARFDKKSGEKVGIQPVVGKDEPALRWNWDAPLIISPHSNTRLYFAANKLFKSDDRGDNWTAISGDLTRQIDRNQLEVMDRVWGVDAVAKSKSTSIYGNIVALAESPKVAGLLYVGTDDGLIQVTEDDGGSWRKIARFPVVPEKTYVNALVASQHDEGTVYAAFNNHKNGDFAPYILKSKDRGQTWQNITANLPKRGSVYALVEDHVDPNLLFAGTEFGVFFSNDGGQKWIQLKAGLPTIAVRDIAIQQRENDLVLATFGRGFYVLDDYSALREANSEVLTKPAHIFPVKDALMFVEARPLGYKGKSFQGASYYAAENPPVGAVFTYYLKETIKTRKQKRQEAEKKARKKGEAVVYPTKEELRLEDTEEDPYLIFTVKDPAGEVVRRIKKGMSKGVNRVVWDFRYPSATPTSLGSGGSSSPWSDGPSGHLALPGEYTITMAQSDNGVVTEIAGPVSFKTVRLNNLTLPAADQNALDVFQKKVGRLQRAVTGTNRYRGELSKRVQYVEAALQSTPGASLSILEETKALNARLREVDRQLNGDRSLSKREFETPPGVSGRVGTIVYNLWNNHAAPTGAMKNSYQIAGEALTPIQAELRDINEKLNALENQLEAAGAPWTPGRLPEWKME